MRGGGMRAGHGKGEGAGVELQIVEIQGSDCQAHTGSLHTRVSP